MSVARVGAGEGVIDGSMLLVVIVEDRFLKLLKFSVQLLEFDFQLLACICADTVPEQLEQL